jgi:hypothetical protein
MRAKISIFCIASLLTLPSLAAAAVPAETTIGGSTYSFTFYTEKNLTAGATYCLTFTQDGSILGYAQSGEFTESTGNLKGSWYESGDEIILSAYSSSLTDAIPMIGRILSGASRLGGRFIDYFPADTNANIPAAGTFYASKVTSCPASPATTFNGMGSRLGER